MEEVVSKSALETERIAAEFSKRLKGGDTVALYGDLGAGKTTFVQGLAKGLGIKKRIISPTFIIMRTYQLPSTNPPAGEAGYKLLFTTFHHIDLYRLENSKQIEALGLKELMSNPENLVVIEWAEKLKEYLPSKRFDIFFEDRGEASREIVIKKLE